MLHVSNVERVKGRPNFFASPLSNVLGLSIQMCNIRYRIKAAKLGIDFFVIYSIHEQHKATHENIRKKIYNKMVPLCCILNFVLCILTAFT